jgi:hypothetical protein
MDRVGQVVCTEIAGGNALPTQLRHPRALVEAHYSGAPGRQSLGVQTWAAGRVQHGASGHVSKKPQTGRAVVVGVVEVVTCVVEEFVGEHVVLRMRTYGIRNVANGPTRGRQLVTVIVIV